MSTRHVKVGRALQVVTNRWAAGKRPGFTAPHEHVTLETPKSVSETQRLRALSVRDTKEPQS